MKRVFLNADDFGLTAGVSAGIVEALQAGVLGSTTAMVCVPDALSQLALWAPEIRGRCGLHLQLTAGSPCCEPASIPSLVTPDGRFPRRREDLGELDPADVRREWRAQLAAFRSTGLEPSRLDSHHHAHRAPGAFPIYVELARELGVPARGRDPELVRALRRLAIVGPDVSEMAWREKGPPTMDELLLQLDRSLQACPAGGTVELMCHPGRVDAELERVSSYAGPRAAELGILCRPGLREMIEERGARLLPAS